MNATNEEFHQLNSKMDVIIALLARNVLNEKEVRRILFKRRTKRGKRKALKAYNALNGDKSISDVADISGMDQGNLSRTLQRWEEHGIIYLDHSTGQEKYYRHVFPVAVPDRLAEER